MCANIQWNWLFISPNESLFIHLSASTRWAVKHTRPLTNTSINALVRYVFAIKSNIGRKKKQEKKAINANAKIKSRVSTITYSVFVCVLMSIWIYLCINCISHTKRSDVCHWYAGTRFFFAAYPDLHNEFAYKHTHTHTHVRLSSVISGAVWGSQVSYVRRHVRARK